MSCKCRFHCPKKKYKNTNLEDILRYIVLKEFPNAQSQVRFGSYTVDMYVPRPYHLAFEADGDYWHKRPGAKQHDERRDSILKQYYKLPVVRLSQKDLLAIENIHINENKNE